MRLGHGKAGPLLENKSGCEVHKPSKRSNKSDKMIA